MRTCPTCNAGPGEPCRSRRSGHAMTMFHSSRYQEEADMPEPDDTTPYDYEKQPFTTAIPEEVLQAKQMPGAMVIPGAPWQTQFQKDADRFATRWNTFDVDSDAKRLRLQRLEKIGPDAILTSPNASRLCDNVSDALWLGWDPEYVAEFLVRWCTANEVRLEHVAEGVYPTVYINGVPDPKFYDGVRVFERRRVVLGSGETYERPEGVIWHGHN